MSYLPRALLAALVGTVVGCATKPPEKPIVLRRPPPSHRALPTPPRPAAMTAVQAAPAPAGTPPDLTPDQKSELFRDFDRYLARPEPQP